MIMILVYPFTELLSGYIFGYNTNKIITNSYVALICWLIFIHLCSSKKQINKIVILFSVLVTSTIFISIVGAFIDGYTIKYDFTLYTRSILFGLLLYVFLINNSDVTIYQLVNKFSVIWWCLITLFIFLSYYLDIGLYTYDKFQIGNKFYFTSNNELSILYSTISIFLALKNTKILRYVIIAFSIYTFLLIGTKSFIVSLILIFYIHLLFYIYNKIGIHGIIIYIATTLSIFIVAINKINIITMFVIHGFSKYSSGGAKLLHKLTYLGEFTALLGERNILIRSAIESIKQLDTFNIFFGISYSRFGIEFGQITGYKFKFSENDLVDVGISYGLIGLSFLLVILFDLFIKIWKTNGKDTRQYIGLLCALNVLALGIVSGHGIFFSLPVLLFVCMYALGKPYHMIDNDIISASDKHHPINMY